MAKFGRLIKSEFKMQDVKPEKQNKGKIALGILAAIVGVLAVCYVGGFIFYQNHFFFGTKISGVNASNKTVEEVEKSIEKDAKDYSLTLKEREGQSETIKAISGQAQGSTATATSATYVFDYWTVDNGTTPISTNAEFVPPNPNELDITYFIVAFSFALLATKFKSHSGSNSL